jgi:predicted Holliday junction resolvase-like endonuclease
MSIELILISVLSVLFLATFILYVIASINKLTWQEKYNSLLSKKKSSETRIGQVYEQMAPFLDGFKHNPKDSHFLGQPIDYVIFEEDKIVFLEVKYGKSQLSPKQEAIKRLVEGKKVVWEELRNTQPGAVNDSA